VQRAISTFGMQHRVVKYNFSDDSGNYTASILRDEENFRKSAYFSILKIEALWPSETLVDFFPIKAFFAPRNKFGISDNIGAGIAQSV
jgi:hypothetical protein